MTASDRLVEEYLRRLERALRPLPAAQRREILGDIRAHIEVARSTVGGAAAGEADTRSILDRIGETEDVAAAAGAGAGAPRARYGAMEIAALILLPVGGVVIPLVGWCIGVLFLWLSPAWRVLDKVIGTLLPPGGYAFLFVLGIALVAVPASPAGSAACSVELPPTPVAPGSGTIPTFTATGGSSCSAAGSPLGWPLEALGIGLLVIALILPLVTAIYLGLRCRRPLADWDAADNLVG